MLGTHTHSLSHRYFMCAQVADLRIRAEVHRWKDLSAFRHQTYPPSALRPSKIMCAQVAELRILSEVNRWEELADVEGQGALSRPEAARFTALMECIKKTKDAFQATQARTVFLCVIARAHAVGRAVPLAPTHPAHQPTNQPTNLLTDHPPTVAPPVHRRDVRH